MAFNILVVDDSKTVRSIIAKTLQLAQVPLDELFEAANGREALSALENNRIDMIFADINMPVMSGVELVDAMRENGMLKKVPVVIVSTEGSSTRVEELKEKGVSAYIRKPFTPESIRNVVDQLMESKNGAEA